LQVAIYLPVGDAPGQQFSQNGVINAGKVPYDIAVKGVAKAPRPGLALVQRFVRAFANPAGAQSPRRSPAPAAEPRAIYLGQPHRTPASQAQ